MHVNIAVKGLEEHIDDLSNLLMNEVYGLKDKMSFVQVLVLASLWKVQHRLMFGRLLSACDDTLNLLIFWLAE